MSYYRTYVENPFVQENAFIGKTPETAEVPRLEQVRNLLPRPHWAGHATAIDCYWKTWELAFRNLRRPNAENGFVSNYIDTAFNDNLFMWDSAFILLFARFTTTPATKALVLLGAHAMSSSRWIT